MKRSRGPGEECSRSRIAAVSEPPRAQSAPNAEPPLGPSAANAFEHWDETRASSEESDERARRSVQIHKAEHLGQRPWQLSWTGDDYPVGEILQLSKIKALIGDIEIALGYSLDYSRGPLVGALTGGAPRVLATPSPSRPAVPSLYSP